MVAATRKWIVRQLSLGEFGSRRDVFRHAFWMALKIAALAYGMNIVAHFGLYFSGLLPYGLFPALVIATVLTPPVSFIVAVAAYSVVGLAVHDLAISRIELERLSRTDMLSGLLNRRAFHDAFDNGGAEITLTLFDIDRFKSVNDTYGHKAGDDVIAAVAEVLRSTYGPEHVCARIGGEEFAVLSPGHVGPDALAIAEAARNRIAEARIDIGPGKALHVTVSGGIADSTGSRGFSDIFAAADIALYIAKADGRNRIIRAGDVESLLPNRRQRVECEELAPPLLLSA